MDAHGLPTHSPPESSINAQRESHILGRPREQKGKKRKNDGEHAKGFKKRKEGLTRDLKNLDKEISRLNSKISDQENLMDKLLNQLMPGSEELELLKEEFAILRPDPNWDVSMSQAKRPGDIISLLKYRTGMLERQILLLYEMKFK